MGNNEDKMDKMDCGATGVDAADAAGVAGAADSHNNNNSIDVKIPARYKLYDGIKEKVSLRMMDNIIIAIIAIVLILLFIGIFGN